MVSMTTVLWCHGVTIGQRLGQAGQPGRQRPEVVILARPSCVAVRAAGLAGSGAGWLVPVCLAPLPADGPV